MLFLDRALSGCSSISRPVFRAACALMTVWTALTQTGAASAGAAGDPSIDRETRRFVELAERFGSRTEDWYTAYFFRPKDVVFDSSDAPRVEEFETVAQSVKDAFNSLVASLDTDEDRRFTLRDDGFDPEDDAEVMRKWDRNKDGILSESDMAPQASASMASHIRRLLNAVPEGSQRYAGWPIDRAKPERAIEEKIFQIQRDVNALEHSDREHEKTLVAELQKTIASRAELLAPRWERGRKLFEERCAGCHGKTGRGDGPAAPFIGNDLEGTGNLAPPRDFSHGIFKFQRRDSGKLPADGDLYATIRRGMPGSAMPAWTELADEQVWDLVDHVKHLVDEAYLEHYKDKFVPLFLMVDRNPDVQGVPDPPADSPELRKVGRYSFLLMQCYTCHGVDGRGDGFRAIQRDSNGRFIQARNYQITRLLKGGSTPPEISRTIAHGIGSTPMPAHTDEALLIPNDMPADFVVAVKVGGAADTKEEFFDEDEKQDKGDGANRVEFRLVEGLAQDEVDRVKTYVAGLPAREDFVRMSEDERAQRAQIRRWALTYYVRSLMPQTPEEAQRARGSTVPTSAPSDDRQRSSP